jgi:Flp pilus assembly protein TadB
MQRRNRGVDEVQFLMSIQSELRAGASLRWALATAAGSASDPALDTVRRLALAGVPLVELAPKLDRLPVNGPRLAAALQVASVAGGRSAQVFARLAERAVEEASLIRERRALTVQARMSAVVVGGLPLLWVLLGGMDRVRTLTAAGGVGVAVAAAGIGMELAGGFLVWRLARA